MPKHEHRFDQTTFQLVQLKCGHNCMEYRRCAICNRWYCVKCLAKKAVK